MIEVGATVGNYQVLQKIGAGAMGNVFLAHHPVIGKRVALKVIHPELASNEEMIARFFNEARAVTQIGHENIVDVQDFGQTPSGDSFIVMELLEGQSLGDKLKREGALSVERAIHIASQLASGLAAAHARGIIHRDLKPDNIFLIQRGGDPDFVKLLDFGLAKLTGPSQAVRHQTKTGSLLGTPHYMAPEQAENVKTIDHRADVYSLGCILFQILTGRVPFPGEGFGEVLVRHVREPPPLPSRLNPAVPPALERIILHALAKKPEFRFASMDEFQQALRDPDRFAQTLDGQGLRLTPGPMPAVRAPAGYGPPPPAPPPPSHTSSSPRVSHDAATMLAQPAPDAATIQRALQQQQAAPRPASKPAPAPKSNTSTPLLIAAATLLVAAAGFSTYWFFLRPTAIAITLITTPAGAQAFDADHPLGTTPLATHLSASPHQLTFKKPGYLTAQRSLTPRTPTTLNVHLLPIPTPDAEEPAPNPTPVAATPPQVTAKPPQSAAKPPQSEKPAQAAPAKPPQPEKPAQAAPKKRRPPPLKKEDTLILTPSF